MIDSTQTEQGVRLRLLDASSFAQYLKAAIRDYTADLVRASLMSLADAAAKAERDIADLREQGPDGKDHKVYAVQRCADGITVGALWLGTSTNWRTAFVYDIRVDEPWRGQGLGRATLATAERRASELGADRLSLHVFGDNVTARKLYLSSGFAETNVNMSKPLPRNAI